MMSVVCDKCGENAVGFVSVGDPTGQRRFDLCKEHLAGIVSSLSRYFGVDMVKTDKGEEFHVEKS
jgi:hypothetical protein